MKRILVLAIAVVLLVSSVSAVLISTTLMPANKDAEFYVGVTFGGANVTDAKQLIDKVKTYTNLFVLLSGEMQDNITNINEVGDYAVASGLHFMVYFGTDKAYLMNNWLEAYDGHWNSSFLGFYYGDELGGKMLDGERQFYGKPNKPEDSFLKYADGKISGYKINQDWQLTYYRDGTIQAESLRVTSFPDPDADYSYSFTNYYPNGTVATTTTTSHTNGSVIMTTTPEPNAPLTYEQLWNARPLQSFDETAQRIVSSTDYIMNRYPKSNFTYLTSDYALYWFDYLGGYDAVLAQLGWNQTVEKDIGLVRGAANLQNLSWGTIVTWKYTQAPYLGSGDEIYRQMRLSYECGAKYVLVFNYAENMTGPYGTLQEEHFQAIERFWNEVVENPSVGHGSTKAEAAFVLPQNYGGGLRKEDDTVWGLWQTPGNYSQIWSNLQAALSKYGSKLDIVYADPAYPVAGKYPQVYYWNQTG